MLHLMTIATLSLVVQSALPGAPVAPPPTESVAESVAESSAESHLPPRTLGALDQIRFDECHDAAIADPATGIYAANEWLVGGGGFLARQCLGFAQARRGEFAAAAESFAQAARDAEAARDWRSANLWVQAGNAALAGGNAASAREQFTAALAQGTLTGLLLGEAYLDRARAALAMEDMVPARTDLDQAAVHAPQDPLIWLLSATLSRRQNDLARAEADIMVAHALGPRDATIALESGNIAASAGNLDAALARWQAAADLGGATPAGDAARARLAELATIRASPEQVEPIAHPSTATEQAAPAPPAQVTP